MNLNERGETAGYRTWNPPEEFGLSDWNTDERRRGGEEGFVDFSSFQPQMGFFSLCDTSRSPLKKTTTGFGLIVTNEASLSYKPEYSLLLI